jgi:hypothetical protein
MSFGLSAGTIGLIGAGASLAGGIMGAGAAGDAADAQAQSAAQSDATQRYFYDTTRKDNAPFLANGTAASNSLARRLGLGGSGPGTGSVDESDPVWQGIVADYQQQHRAKFGTDPTTDYNAGPDERALYDHMASLYQQTKANMGQPVESDAGSLLKKFTTADMQADPVYSSGLQFGLDEGRKGIERQAAATGSSLSGATLKALTRFGNDYGSTKANDAYNRFTSDQTNTYNRLAGVAGSGQTASGQVGSAGATASTNISQSQQSAGNARSAGYIGGANAVTGGLMGGVNAYQNNRLIDLYGQRAGSTSGSGLMSELKRDGVF